MGNQTKRLHTDIRDENSDNEDASKRRELDDALANTELNKQISQLTKEKNELQEQLKGKEQEVDSLQTQLKTEKEAKEAAESDNSTLTERITQLTNENTELQGQINALTTQIQEEVLNNTIEKRINNFVEECSSIITTISRINCTHDAVCNFLERWASEIFKLTNDKVRFDSFFHNLVSYKIATTIDDLNNITEKALPLLSKGFNPYHIIYALSRLSSNDTPDDFFNFLDEELDKMSEQEMTTGQFSSFIFAQASYSNGITIAELEKKLEEKLK